MEDKASVTADVCKKDSAIKFYKDGVEQPG